MLDLRSQLRGYQTWFARGRPLALLRCELCERETIHARRGKAWVCLELTGPRRICLAVHAMIDKPPPPD